MRKKDQLLNVTFDSLAKSELQNDDLKVQIDICQVIV